MTIDKPISTMIAPAFRDCHRAIRDRTASELMLKGGRGSGKSSFVSVEIILGMYRDDEANAIVYRKVGDTLRDSVYAQMVWAIELLGASADWQTRLAPMEIIRRKTGQRIIFRGADDPQKSKGIKLQRGYFRFLWFEELTEFGSMKEIRTIKASVIRGGDTLTIYTYNPPQSAANWVNGESIKAVAGRTVHASTYLDVPPEWLGETFLNDAEALKETDEKAYRHMYLGEVTGTGGTVFENLTLREIPDSEIMTMGSFYDGLDFGYWPDPSHWVRTAYDAGRRTLYVLDEIRRYKTGDRELAALLKERFSVWNAWHRAQMLPHMKRGHEPPPLPAPEVICDSASEKPIADLRSEGIRAVGALKGPGSVEAGTKWLRTLKEIVIDPARAPETAKEFAEYEMQKNRAGEFTDTYPDKNNHAIDAVRYALNRVWLRKDR